MTEEHEPVLLWVHTGSATIAIGGTSHRIPAGAAIWIPPGITHRVDTAAGSLVFPYFLRPTDLRGALGELHTVAIPAGWESWMIHCWDDNSYTRDSSSAAGTLLALVADETGVDARPHVTGTPPPLPRSKEALSVARSVLHDPAPMRSLEERARQEYVSVKTLQRQFLNETGMSFSIWRARARISLAARSLAEGRGVADTGRAVGYATTATFVKAFRSHTGLHPDDCLRRVRRAVDDGAGRDVHPPGRLRHVVHRSAAYPGIPARSFWERINDHHELMWVHRGRAELRIGTERWSLRQGQAMWIPAGVAHSIDFPPESLMLTVGVVHGRVRAATAERLVFEIPQAWEAVLLHLMIAEFSGFSSTTPDTDFVGARFRDQFEPADGDCVDGVVGEISRALRAAPDDARSLEAWAGRFGTASNDLGGALVAASGRTFPQWRARIRMDVARELLRAGEHPGRIHERVGYTSHAALCRAFSTVYGMSPGAYQRREVRQRSGIASAAR